MGSKIKKLKSVRIYGDGKKTLKIGLYVHGTFKDTYLMFSFGGNKEYCIRSKDFIERLAHLGTCWNKQRFSASITGVAIPIHNIISYDKTGFGFCLGYNFISIEKKLLNKLTIGITQEPFGFENNCLCVHEVHFFKAIKQVLPMRDLQRLSQKSEMLGGMVNLYLKPY